MSSSFFGGDVVFSERQHTRLVTTRTVTFTCACCGETVIQERFPARMYLYCSDECRGEAETEITPSQAQQQPFYPPAF
ncbi:MAG: hypothetical protein KME08_21135 [Aphanothece sp. CMT-3BRIN-NPC111]|jgi:hypothetical protein|nr:hypothetical protein [Aphanothece sp. CMT-3BRIN-NPC111]